MVVCGKQSAYVERTDRAFLDNVDPYYASLTEVDDLLGSRTRRQGRRLLLRRPRVHDRAGAGHFRETHQVVVSGEHWVDVMHADMTRASPYAALQDELGVTAAQTVVFGDYLNDVEMIDAADLSFAMANAHPEVLARARYRAPANTEHGVMRDARRPARR